MSDPDALLELIINSCANLNTYVTVFKSKAKTDFRTFAHDVDIKRKGATFIGNPARHG